VARDRGLTVEVLHQTTARHELERSFDDMSSEIANPTRQITRRN
jgi:hypothetical protein